jgi:hypothetical protein
VEFTQVGRIVPNGLPFRLVNAALIRTVVRTIFNKHIAQLLQVLFACPTDHQFQLNAIKSTCLNPDLPMSILFD